MKPIGTVFILAVLTAASTPGRAQTAATAKPAAPAKPATPAMAGTSIKAKSSQWQGNTLRLDGNVRIVAPGQLDVAADAIAVDVGEKTFNQIRALGNVKLKVDVPARNGGTPFHVESSSQSATLDPKTSTLVLSGKVTGWYQPKGGERTLLGGEKVNVKFDKANVSVDAVGGAIPLTFTVAVPNEGAFAGIGTITVTGKQANLNQTSDSTVTGGARAFSSGTRKFDVLADKFVVSRDANGDLDTLKTAGRTTLISDIPAGAMEGGSVGTPVRIEVTSDSALLKRADNSLTFEGHVKGLYVLQNAAGQRTAYPFSSETAVLKLIPATATTKADYTLFTSETSILAPEFNLGM